MGAFFPEGIRRLGVQEKAMIGWAWGSNSFATVVGSIMAVIASINWNFTVVLILAAIVLPGGGLLQHPCRKSKNGLKSVQIRSNS